MKKHYLFSFLSGFLFSAIAFFIFYVIVYFFVLVNNGYLFDEPQNFDEIQDQALFFLMINMMLTAVLVFVSISFIRSSKKYTGSGIVFTTLVVIIIFAYSFFSEFQFAEKFEKEIWLQNEVKPIGMAMMLMKENKLQGKNSDEIKNLLGEKKMQYYDNKSYLNYNVDGIWNFVIYFEKGKVIGAEIRRPWLI